MSDWSEFFQSKQEMVDALQAFEKVKVLVVGDVGLDEYIFGHVDRISPEAPVPVVEVQNQDRRLGLSANVAANITQLGGQAILLGLVGEDLAAQELKEELEKHGIDPQYLVKDPQRPTTKKIRVVAGTQQLVRVDFEKKAYLEKKVEEEFLNQVNMHLDQVDGVILQDYAKGLLSESLCQKVIALCKQQGKKVLVDPHRSTPVEHYKGADLFKPNRDEAVLLSGYRISEWRSRGGFVDEVAQQLLKKVQCAHLVLTEGKQGMNLYSAQGKVSFPTYAREVYDVSGAGDTVIATMALGWLAGMSLEKSCILANLAAGVVVGYVGSIPCHKKDLVSFILNSQF